MYCINLGGPLTAGQRAVLAESVGESQMRLFEVVFEPDQQAAFQPQVEGLLKGWKDWACAVVVPPTLSASLSLFLHLLLEGLAKKQDCMAFMVEARAQALTVHWFCVP